MVDKTSWGTKASILLKYSGDLRSLTELLGNKLEVPNFFIDTDMEPPHEEFAMGGTLGFTIWIYNSTLKPDLNYSLDIETSNCLHEIFDDRMHDISLWFAKYVSLMTDLDCCVSLDKDYFFIKGQSADT
jgi:hypothetical protein